MKQEELARFLSTLSETPDRIWQLTQGLDPKALTWKPSAGAFSVLENVCHLRDIEAEGYLVRIERILREARPTLPDLDGNKLAREREYNSQDLTAVLDAFRTARARSLTLLKGAKPASWEREGHWDGVGRITLEEVLLKMIEHDRGHLDEINQLVNRLAERE